MFRFALNYRTISKIVLFLKLFFTQKNASLKSKFVKYIEIGWNFIDIFGILFFLIATCFRFIALRSNEELFTIAR